MNQRQHKTTLTATLGATLLAVLAALQAPTAQADTQTRTSSFEYNTAGQLSKEVIEPDGPPNDCLQTSYDFDTYGNKKYASTSTCPGASAPATTSASTPRTHTDNYGADGRFVLSSSNTLNHTESKTYDARFGTLTSLTGPNGLTTTWQNDSFGRKTRETRSDGTYTTWAYKLCTETGANCPGPIAGAASTWVLISQSYAVNGATNSPEQRQYHDALNRIVRSQTQGYDGNGAAPTLVQDTEYNTLGQTSRQSNRYALNGGTPVWTSYQYDALGRTTSQSQPDPDAPGGIATTSYSYNALTSTTTNAKGQTRTTTQNAQGQIAQVTDAQGNTISYSYDALGRLLATNAAGSITSMGYDIRGNKTSMLDPAMGAWIYSYNAFGELVSQRDSLGQTTSLSYDDLGRLIQRVEPDLTSQWSYDKKFGGIACGKSIGKLCSAQTDNGYKRQHIYDSLGRQSTTFAYLDDPTSRVIVTETYDPNTGRINSKTWPTGYQANYSYSALGYLTGVSAGGSNGFSQTISYNIQAMNAQGQITQYRTGNTVTTVKTYDPATQRLTSQSATTDGQASANVLNQSYSYDALGNLKTRADNAPGVGTQESYSYDSLNRLTTATLLGGAVSPPSTTEVMYDARGNITYKSDVGRYWYDSARPNRMTAVTLETAAGAIQSLTGTRALSYVFDDLKAGAQMVGGISTGNGNLEYTVSQDTVNNRHTLRAEAYTSFNMPSTISYGNFITNTSNSQDRTLSFVYGPEHQRIKQNVALSGTGTSSYHAGNTWYMNGIDSLGLSYEKEIRDNGTTEHKHYISAGGVVFAEFISRSGNLNGLPASTTNYFHHDQLGSISAITDESGAVVERLAYDPWGKRRNITSNPGLPDTLDAIVGQRTDRGYTEHEHLDEIGVIHMNGRIYDPLVGRFMSADPFIQSPDDLQSYNRYSYVMNNPLARTDPSGYFSLRRLFKAAAVVVVAVYVPSLVTTYISNSAGVAAASSAMAAGSGTMGAMIEGAVAASAAATATSTVVLSGAAGGFAAGLVSTGNLEGGLKGAVTGGLFAAAGGIADPLAHTAAHAAVGCVSSAMGGGNCESGAVSGALGTITTAAVGAVGVDGGSTVANTVAKGVATAVAGGVGSVVAGGKFENGATTAAYGYLFNQVLHREPVPVGTPPPEVQDALSILQPLADQAATHVDATCGLRCHVPFIGSAIRGTLIHSEFQRLVDALPYAEFTTEQSYLNHVPALRGTPGSSRADVVYGPVIKPIVAIDLKTGFWSTLSYPQAVQYGANLPVGTYLTVMKPKN